MKRWLTLFISFLLIPAVLYAAPSFDAVSTGNANGTNTVTSSHTLGGGCSNSYAVVDVAWQLASPTGSVSSVTYGATSLSFIAGEDRADTDGRVEKWGVVNPPTGAQTVTATLNGTKNSLTLTTRTYCGVHQSSSLGTPATASGSSGTATVDVTSASGELVIDGAIMNSDAAATAGASQTERSNFVEGTNHRQVTSDEAGATTTTMSWDFSVNYWAIIGVALKPAVASIPKRGPVVMR